MSFLIKKQKFPKFPHTNIYGFHTYLLGDVMVWNKMFAALVIMGLLFGVAYAMSGDVHSAAADASGAAEVVSADTVSEHANQSEWTSPKERWKSVRDKIREKVQNVAQHYKNAKEEYKDARQKWINVMNRSDMNVSSVRLERAKAFLTKSIDYMISHIQLLSDRISDQESISDEDKADILEELDNNVNYLEELKSDVESAETMSDLREISRSIKEKWMESRAAIKKYTGLLLVAKMENIVGKFEQLLDKLNDKADALEEKGYDVTEIREALDNAEQHIASARAEYELAKESFMSIHDIKDADKLFREGHRHIRKARMELVDAIHEIRSAFKNVLQQGRNQDEADHGEVNETQAEDVQE